MTPSDVLRVREARRRLREVAADPSRLDTAIRVIELESPRTSGVPLVVHPDFAVISGLSTVAREQILATIDAVHQNTPSVGLGGTVVVAGDLYGLHDPDIPSLEPGTELFDQQHDVDVSWTDESELHELVDAAESAVLVTAAELRGADAIASDLRAADVDIPDVIDLRTTDADREEIRQTLDALDALQPDQAAIDELAERLARLAALPSTMSLRATVEQYSAALERVQPTDPEHVRNNLERALDDAVEARNAQERSRRTEVFGMIDALGRVGVRATADDAVVTAERVLAERNELLAIRARLVDKLDIPAVRIRHVQESTELIEIERRTASLRRRLRTQRHILTSARLMLATVDGRPPTRSTINEAMGPISDHRRALPIVFVEPLADLPAHLGPAVLSILLRISVEHQVLCLSDDEDVHLWAAGLGRRVGWVHAEGWFAGRPEPC